MSKVSMVVGGAESTADVVSLTVNGKAVAKAVEGRTLLVDFLREDLNLTGTHVGCDTSQCGACVVHVNGASVRVRGQHLPLHRLS